MLDRLVLQLRACRQGAEDGNDAHAGAEDRAQASARAAPRDAEDDSGGLLERRAPDRRLHRRRPQSTFTSTPAAMSSPACSLTLRFTTSSSTSLIDVISSDFFRAIRERVPYCENLLRPCLIIDHPALLREIVARHGARPTHPGADALLDDFKDDLDRYAARYGELADEEWYGCYETQPTLKASGQ